MEIFADTYDVEAIKELYDFGILDGVTTNPTILANSGRNYKEVLSDIASIIGDKMLCAQVVAKDCAGMMREANVLRKIAKNFVVKLPITPEGLKACQILKSEGTKVIATVCLSPSQALLAAKCGADYIAPYVGRLNNIGANGLDVVSSMQAIIDNYEYDTKILAASIKSVNDVIELTTMGVGAITTTPDIITSMYMHPLTNKSIVMFDEDWAKSGQVIE